MMRACTLRLNFLPVELDLLLLVSLLALCHSCRSISLPLGPGPFQVAPTLAVAQQINDLPKPLLISCTTQKRSSGLATIYVALQRGFSAGEALDWAEAHSMPFLQVPAMRNWVVFCIDSSLRGSDGYSASM